MFKIIYYSNDYNGNNRRLVINKALDKYIKVYTLTTEYYANIIKMKKLSMY